MEQRTPELMSVYSWYVALSLNSDLLPANKQAHNPAVDRPRTLNIS